MNGVGPLSFGNIHFAFVPEEFPERTYVRVMAKSSRASESQGGGAQNWAMNAMDQLATLFDNRRFRWRSRFPHNAVEDAIFSPEGHLPNGSPVLPTTHSDWYISHMNGLWNSSYFNSPYAA